MSDVSKFSSDFQSTASIEILQQRAGLLRRLRTFFDERGFIEVETPLLSSDTVVDRHVHPIPVDRSLVTGAQSDEGRTLYLQTSPEFAMKRLLACGVKSIYQIGKAFRQGESGRSHNPEFTMLEWYRVGDDMAAGMKLLAELVESILETSPVKCMSYREAFLEFAGIDVVEAEPARLSELSDLSPEVIRDEHLNIILAKEVEPKLGQELPVLLYDYPATQAALAKIRIDRGVAYAERFELYFKGVELANGYHELLDPDELELRNEEVNRQRISDGRQPLPSSSRLLSAMQFGLPSCAGVAMGVDRLLMLDQNLSSIDEALAFPFDRA